LASWFSFLLFAAGFFTEGMTFPVAAGLALVGLFLSLGSRGGVRALGVVVGASAFILSAALFVVVLWAQATGRDLFTPGQDLSRPRQEEWGDKTLIDGVEVNLQGWNVGRVRLSQLGQLTDSPEELLSIRILIRNTDPNRRLVYAGWGAHNLDGGVWPLLRDEHGNIYRINHFAPFAEVVGQAKSGTAIEPGGALTDVLVFDRPVATARELRLALPGQAVGRWLWFRFSFPAP
jgi:hypothetical protein